MTPQQVQRILMTGSTTAAEAGMVNLSAVLAAMASEADKIGKETEVRADQVFRRQM